MVNSTHGPVIRGSLSVKGVLFYLVLPHLGGDSLTQLLKFSWAADLLGSL